MKLIWCFLSIVYSVSICQLFNPFLEFKGLSSTGKTHVREIIVESAIEGIKLYRRYCDRFSNRYQAPLQAYCLVHVCDVLLRHDRANSDHAIRFCLQNLGVALPGFPVVGPLQAMFCESVLSSGHELPKNVDEMMGGRTWQSYTREDRLGCSERLTYAQPVDLLAEAIDVDFGETFRTEWNKFIETQGNEMMSDGEGHQRSESSSVGADSMRAMHINSLMNP